MLSWDCAMVSDAQHAPPLLQSLELGATDEALEGCMLQLESKSMSPFLEKVREKEACGHCAISLYSELAQVHKQAIIPFIPRIMASIVRSLSFSNGGAHMHAACARVMGSVAKYTIDSTKPPHSNHEILCNLCSPLLAVLCGKPEPASLGAAVCLQVLVESENWRFAQADLQSILCDKVSCALAQSASPDEPLLLLTKSLTKFSRDAALGHMCEWLRVALEFLQTNIGRSESKLHQHVAAIQLITSILKIADGEDILNMADADKLYSDLQMAAEAMEACRCDVVPGLHTELAEALRAMRRLASGKSSISQHDSATGDAQQSCDLRHAKPCTQEGHGSLDQDLQMSKSLASGTLGISPSCAAKSGLGLKHSPIYRLKQMKEKSMYGSFASVVSPKIKESTQEIIARQAYSEASTLPKVSSDNSNCLHVLPKGVALMCKAVNGNTSTLGSSKGSPDVDINTTGKRLTGKNRNADNSQNQSDIECTCSIEFVRREGSVRSRSVGDSVDEMDCKIVSEKDGKTCVEHDESSLDENKIEATPIGSSHHHETMCTNDSNARPNKLADDVLCNGCTDLLLTPDANKGAAISTSMGKSSLTKVVKSQVLMDHFGFTTPRRLLHFLQSASKADMQDVEGCCMDACHNHTHFETSIDTPISSCCTAEDLGPSASKDSKQSLHCRGQGFHRSIKGCDQFSLRLDNCEIHAHGEGRVSLEGCSDENALLTAEKKGNAESEGAIQQSSNGFHCCGEMENHTKSYVKMKGKGYSGKMKVKNEMLMGACIGVICTLAMLVSALLFSDLINYSTNDLQVLVPT